MAKQDGECEAPRGWWKWGHKGCKGADPCAPCCSEQIVTFTLVRNYGTAKVLPCPSAPSQEEGAAMGVRETRPSVPEGERLWPWVAAAAWAGLPVLPAASLQAEVCGDL